ncbi:MAG: hypothetical protein LBT78_06255 [Tannerella sp.]|jgi:abortive infection bacteriophage resistance protein|nr:hypothetical protein [Tannerella sp.]
MKVDYNKTIISYQSQIALLKSRGMKFPNENKALHLLENISQRGQGGYGLSRQPATRTPLAIKFNVV